MEKDSDNIESEREVCIPESLLREIIGFAEKSKIQKITLFGSRATGTNTPRSDIDIAVSGGNFDDFYWDIKENTQTLLMFDVIDVDSGISEELANEIKQKGVVIYEKIR